MLGDMRMSKERKSKPAFGGWIMPATDDKAPNGKDKVHVKLVGEDGNAFAIIGRCDAAMRKAGWSKEEIRLFNEEPMTISYQHLMEVVANYTYQT